MSKVLKLWVIYASCIFIFACSTKKKMVINKEQIQAPKQINTKKTYEEEIKQVVLHSNNVNWYYTKSTAKYDDGKQEIVRYHGRKRQALCQRRFYRRRWK